MTVNSPESPYELARAVADLDGHAPMPTNANGEHRSKLNSVVSTPSSSSGSADNYKLLEENIEEVDVNELKRGRLDAYGEEIGGSASELTDVINLVKSIMGSGILTTPWAFSLASTTPAFTALVVVFCVSSVSFLMVSEAGKKSQKQIYAEIWEVTYGPKWAVFPDIIIVFLNYFTCTGYIILVGDFIPQVFQQVAPGWPFADRTNAILLCTFCILLPLAWLKDLTSLRFTSIIGVGCIIYTIVAVGIRSFEYVDDGRPGSDPLDKDWQWFDLSASFFTALSIFYYAFDAHANGAIMYSEHEVAGRDFPSWKRVVWGAMFIVLLLTGTFGYFAYYAFGESTEDNVLTNFPLDDDLILAARVAMAFSVLSTYPFWFNSMRRSLDGTIYRAAPSEYSARYLDLPFRREVQTIIMIGLTMGLALLVTDIGPFLALVASAFGVFEMYIIPGILYLGVMKFETTREKVPAYAIIVVGIVFGILGTTITLLEWIQDD